MSINIDIFLQGLIYYLITKSSDGLTEEEITKEIDLFMKCLKKVI